MKSHSAEHMYTPTGTLLHIFPTDNAFFTNGFYGPSGKYCDFQAYTKSLYSYPFVKNNECSADTDLRVARSQFQAFSSRKVSSLKLFLSDRLISSLNFELAYLRMVSISMQPITFANSAFFSLSALRICVL